MTKQLALDLPEPAELKRANEAENENESIPRPRTRADCVNGPRPCPYVGCRHHLEVVHVYKTGEVREPLRDLATLSDSCSLDLADRAGERGMTFDEIAKALGTSRQNVHEIYTNAMAKLAKRMK